VCFQVENAPMKAFLFFPVNILDLLFVLVFHFIIVGDEFQGSEVLGFLNIVWERAAIQVSLRELQDGFRHVINGDC